MSDLLLTKAVRVYQEFVDILLPCKNIDFNIRGVILWAREHATAQQKYNFICHFYGVHNARIMTGAYQMSVSSGVIYKEPFDKTALKKLELEKLFDIFEISGCPSEYFSIYFLEYNRVSKIRSRTYMNKVTKLRKEYTHFIQSILKE